MKQSVVFSDSRKTNKHDPKFLEDWKRRTEELKQEHGEQ